MAVAFGTSGLRGPAADFTPRLCDAYIGAFLEHCLADTPSKTVYVGGDLRQSTPEIAAYCCSAAVALGWKVVWAGNVPTPALAFYALKQRACAIMVTGSHIPESYNGIKFYRPDGEFLKEDEAPVRARAENIISRNRVLLPVPMSEPDPAIERAYVERYTACHRSNALEGLKIGVDLHSAVGRDILVEILQRLGATVVAFRRSSRFIAVDTEAPDPDDMEFCARMIFEHGLDGVVSTDGDGDRPLVIDERGNQINGDVLGMLTAKGLAIKSVVTPLSSTSAVEQSGWFAHIERTRIGSPFVVASMADATLRPVAGFEANGGFLLGDDVELAHGALERLPTRDALLPILAVLVQSKKLGLGLGALAATIPPRFMRADRVKDFPNDKSRAFLASIHQRDIRVNLDKKIADPLEINALDGMRMVFSDGSIVHFRQSGNAPELRCYVETSSIKATQALLGSLMEKLKALV